MDVAIELFKQNGYNNVSVEDIVKVAQLSRGSFYVHYKNKDDLLAGYLQAVESKYLEFYSKELCSGRYAEKDPVDRLCIFLKYVNQVLSRNGQDLLRVYYSYLLRYTDTWATRDRHYFAVLHLLLGDARRESLLTNRLTEEVIVNMALYLTRGISMEWSVCDHEYPISDHDYMIDSFCMDIRNA